LNLLLDIIRENVASVNQHVIIIGPRGIGKTMLVLRLALAVRQDESLSRSWYPVVLPEEIYDVANEGEVWLRVLERIAVQEREAGRDYNRWLQSYESLRGEREEQRLKVKALAVLSEFAGEHNNRLLVIIENLQMILGEQSGSDSAWDLRHTLLNNSEIMIIATATTHFKEIMNAESANFELFREITLAPLSTEDCRVLWRLITGEDLVNDRIRPMEVLTGGSPRLLAILADFSAGKSLTELMDDLVVLIDDHTTYFKANVEALPALERRVFVTLAELWEPAEARQVARRCRLEVNKTSALLKRLVEKGAVVEAGKVGRKNLYQVAERLYNIYHLMRLSGIETDRVRALVRFMIPMYGQERVAHALAAEAYLHEGEHRKAWIDGYREILADAACRSESLERLRQATPESFFVLPETSDIAHTFNTILPDLKVKEQKQEIQILEDRVAEAFKKGNFESAINQLDILLSRLGNNDDPVLRETIAGALFNKGHTLESLNRHEEAITLYDNITRCFGEADDPTSQESVAHALIHKGVNLGRLKREEEAIVAYDELIRRFGEADDSTLYTYVGNALFNKGGTLHGLGRMEEAIVAYDELIRRFGEADDPALREGVAHGLFNKGVDLGRLKREEEAIAVYDELIRRFGEADDPALCEQVARGFVNKGIALGNLKRTEEAIAVYDELIRRFGEADDSALCEGVARGFFNKGADLDELGRREEAIAVYDELIRRFGEADDPALCEQVACALCKKSIALGELGRGNEEISVHDDMLRRFATTSDPAVRKAVACSLNVRAWSVYAKKDNSMIDQGILDAKKALQIDPNNAYRHTLASLFALASRWDDAFAEARLFADDDSVLSQSPDDVIDFFVYSASQGKAEEALRAIKGTKAESAMEPLVIALKMATGQPFRAPQEVVEVAKDVLKRIEERQPTIESKCD
jgi:tetratricopeptide (TPR) repeat protein